MFLEIFKEISSPVLAFECCKAKSERVILNNFAYHIERKMEEINKNNIYSWLEYVYSHFLNNQPKPFKYIRADLALVDKLNPDMCYAVFEAKMNYTFDCFRAEFENMKKAMENDLTRLVQITTNKMGKNLQEYFLQFLVHYSKNNVHDYDFVYGTGHNSTVSKNNSHEYVIKEAERIFDEYIETEVFKKFDIQEYKKDRISLGFYKGVEVKLSIFMLELD